MYFLIYQRKSASGTLDECVRCVFGNDAYPAADTAYHALWIKSINVDTPDPVMRATGGRHALSPDEE